MVSPPLARGGRRTGFTVGVLVAAASILPGSTEAGDASINLHVDEAFVELIRGIRRAEGRDPPDAAADQRLRTMLDRLRDQDAIVEDPADPRAVPAANPGCVELVGA